MDGLFGGCRAQEAYMRWAPNGAAVLIHTHTDLDATGGSYYGSTGKSVVPQIDGHGSYDPL